MASFTTFLIRFNLFVRLKKHLQLKHFGSCVPASRKTTFSLVDLFVRNLKCNVLVRSCSKYQILEILIRCLHLLLKSTHETMTRLETRFDFWILNFEEQTVLSCCRITLLDYLVSRSSNLDRSMNHSLLNRCGDGFGRFALSIFQRFYNLQKIRTRTSSCQIGHMSPSLCVCKKVGFSVMHSETQPALNLAQMVSQQIGILHNSRRNNKHYLGDIGRLHCQFKQSISSRDLELSFRDTT